MILDISKKRSIILMCKVILLIAVSLWCDYKFYVNLSNMSLFKFWFDIICLAILGIINISLFISASIAIYGAFKKGDK